LDKSCAMRLPTSPLPPPRSIDAIIAVLVMEQKGEGLVQACSPGRARKKYPARHAFSSIIGFTFVELSKPSKFFHEDYCIPFPTACMLRTRPDFLQTRAGC